MGEDGNRMIDREALAAALAFFYRDGNRDGYWGMVQAAARERLAQLPEKCGTCILAGDQVTDNTAALQAQWDGCPTCHGKGVLYPPALVERIASVIVEHFLPDPNRKGIWTGRLDAAVAVLDALNTETA